MKEKRERKKNNQRQNKRQSCGQWYANTYMHTCTHTQATHTPCEVHICVNVFKWSILFSSSSSSFIYTKHSINMNALETICGCTCIVWIVYRLDYLINHIEWKCNRFKTFRFHSLEMLLHSRSVQSIDSFDWFIIFLGTQNI